MRVWSRTTLKSLMVPGGVLLLVITVLLYSGWLTLALPALSFLYYATEDVPAALLAARKAYEQDAYLTAAPDILSRLFFGSYDLEQLTQAKVFSRPIVTTLVRVRAEPPVGV